MAAMAAAGAAGHTAGIYADMTLDGPEIGTLVVVLDRAKNLPNRRTMGKQNPYCAARLGKEAKKSKTDMRGGQTPRWDQELRFTVHDSPDYNSLKLSIFNDDKKTDLIGETWIDLTEVLHPGGGQSDEWHGLKWKDRYAGEIRIELTYYDSRPKAERHRDRSRKQSTVGVDRDSTSPLNGPRQLQSSIRRRPLPGDPTQIHSQPQVPYQSPPLPPSEYQTYHNPLHAEGYQDDRSGSYGNNEHEYPVRNGLGTSNSALRPLLNPAGSFVPSHAQHELQSPSSIYGDDLAFESNGYAPQLEPHSGQHDIEVSSEPYIPTTDDPYALQAVELYQDNQRTYDQPSQLQQVRHARVQALSVSHTARPQPPIPLAHTHSAPIYGAPDQMNGYPNSVDNPPQVAPYSEHDHLQTINAGFPAQPGYHSPGLDNAPMQYHIENDYHTPTGRSLPPPPPTHRHSAPAVDMGMDKSQPPAHAYQPSTLTHASRYHSGGVENETLYQGYQRDYQQPVQTFGSVPAHLDRHENDIARQIDPRYRRQRSTEGMTSARHGIRDMGQESRFQGIEMQSMVRERASMSAFDPRRNNNTPVRSENSDSMQSSYNTNSQYPSPNHHYPRLPPDQQPPSVRQSNLPPLIKPRPLSPSRPLASLPLPSQQAHNAAAPYSTAQGQLSAIPFSPDSFSVFNPGHGSPGTPTTNSRQSASQTTTPTFVTQTPRTPQQPTPSSSVAEHAEPPIIGSDGRVKDPSDHLPPSSYAPEPERKGGAKSTVVNIRNRFGPRQAPPMPVTTRLPRSPPLAPQVGGTTGLSTNTQQPSQRTQRATGRAPVIASQGTANSAHNTSAGQSVESQGYNAPGYGYDRVEMFAPPVPQKIPLDAPANAYGSDAQLANNMASLGLDGSRDVFGGNGPPNRVRKSRWGA